MRKVSVTSTNFFFLSAGPARSDLVLPEWHHHPADLRGQGNQARAHFQVVHRQDGDTREFLASGRIAEK